MSKSIGDAANADKLRHVLAELLELGPANRLLFAPGVAIGLALVLDRLHAESIILSPSEYLAPAHFPGRDVSVAETEDFAVRDPGVDAIIASPYAWDGRRSAIAKAFKAIAARRRGHRPLLIADWSHAGASGFPNPRRVRADIVCGEVAKWLLPPSIDVGLSVIWCRNQTIWWPCARALEMFYLAVAGTQSERMARWVGPSDLRLVLRHVASMKRETLTRRHKANVDLARRLAVDVPGAVWHGTAIIRVPDDSSHALLSRLKGAGLVWRISGGQARVLCRADLVTPGSC